MIFLDYIQSVKIIFLLSLCLVNCLGNKYCSLSCDHVYKIFPHTVCERHSEKCGPHPRCGPDFKVLEMTNGLRQYVLDIHNYLRNKVALGLQGDQHPAADMQILKYNKDLEFTAQCWASACNGNPLNHDHCRRIEKYEHVGQNLGSINTTIVDVNVADTFKNLILLWYNEVDIFKREWVYETKDRGPNVKVGHYTQMLWANTRELGCAATYYTSESSGRKWNHVLLVCNYGPGGNYLGLPVYTVGAPCTKCPGGTKKNKLYHGLCGDSMKVKLSKKNIKKEFDDVFG